MGTLLASGAFVLAVAGGIIAVDDRYTTKAEFSQLVSGVMELAGSVKEFRLESRLDEHALDVPRGLAVRGRAGHVRRRGQDPQVRSRVAGAGPLDQETFVVGQLRTSVRGCVGDRRLDGRRGESGQIRDGEQCEHPVNVPQWDCARNPITPAGSGGQCSAVDEEDGRAD